MMPARNDPSGIVLREDYSLEGDEPEPDALAAEDDPPDGERIVLDDDLIDVHPWQSLPNMSMSNDPSGIVLHVDGLLDGKPEPDVLAAAAEDTPPSIFGVRIDLDAEMDALVGSLRDSKAATVEEEDVENPPSFLSEHFNQDVTLFTSPAIMREEQMGPGNVYRKYDAASSSASFVPSFKHHVRKVDMTNHNENNHDAVAWKGSHEAADRYFAGDTEAVGYSSGAFVGPDFKDQARPVSRDVAQEGLKHPATSDEDAQARPVHTRDVAQQGTKHTATSDEDATEDPTSSRAVGDDGEPAIIDVEYMDDDQAHTNIAMLHTSSVGTIYNADAFALTGGYFVKRRWIIALAALVILGAVVVGAVCGSGFCQTKSSKAPLVAPPTIMPSLELSCMPVDNESFAILEFINSITLSGKIIEHAVSPDCDSATSEQKAVWWLIQNDPLELSASSDSKKSRLIQRYALLTLWYSLNGEYWKKHNGWLVEEDECSWYGIECTDTKVTTIGTIGANQVWEKNNLSGTIPPDIALLESLEQIYFTNNQNIMGPLLPSMANLYSLKIFNADFCGLSGSLPETIGAAWGKIVDFSIVGNAFAGSLPPSFGNWTNLEWFWASGNQLSGTLSESLGSWSNLVSLKLNANNFSGELPESIGNWRELTEFVVTENSFKGTLPESIGNWTELEVFHVSINDFLGTLPPSLGTWRDINQFSAYSNSFSGTLPEEIVLWQSLKLFSVDQNDLSGTLPLGIGQWSGIEGFWIYDNLFSGTLPNTLSLWKDIVNFEIELNRFSGNLSESIGSWPHLEVFTVSDNKFSGNVTSFVGNWSNAAYVWLANNDFTGTLPETVGAWTGLVEFNASGNGFTGTLPQSIGQWTELLRFDISGCRSLTGSVPESIAQWQKIEVAYFNDTAMVGSIPEELCVLLPELAADCRSEVTCSCCQACY